MSPPIDDVLVGERLDAITSTATRLRDTLSVGRDAFLKDRVRIDAAERQLQVIAQAVVDVSSHLVIAASRKMPATYGDVADELVTLGVIDRSLADRLRKLIGLRNLLVHGYLRIDPGRLFDDAQAGFADFDAFTLAVRQRISGP